MASEAAAVAAAAGAGSTQAESRAIGLDMAKTLAVVALLSWFMSERDGECREGPVCLGFTCSQQKRAKTDQTWRDQITYFRWCVGGGIRSTRGRAACLDDC
ncbi:hypothetical protein K491DRAFT_181965 [Lophiostoma macrostomum CBS 122681]|uniref:Uncharacterized protein n=1 Tax=Lophiostoma macrostomum CBS 122681 TaxID=1314788 RepID=A0A6A6TUA2_9PLEO|nr:hypothetical protein K491DRAFT_181965 [Lophiostoma macrostomum CBS 122681]